MYSSSLCVRFQLPLLSNGVRVLAHSNPQLNFLQCNEKSQQPVVSQSFSTFLEEKQSFTVSYLMNTCGFSSETATSISKKVLFKTPHKPDSVLKLLKSYGFTNTQITKILKQLPRVLVANSQKTLMPKFEFFYSVGLSNSDIVKLVSSNPYILTLSLENRIIPFYNFLRNEVCCEENISKTFVRLGCLAANDVQKNFAPNIAAMKKFGVPESSIFTILLSVSSVVFRDHKVFVKMLKEVLNMGYDPKGTQFIRAMSLFFSLSKSTRENKMAIYKKWGWTEYEISHAIKNYPVFLILSEKKIMKSMDFLVNDMGYETTEIARYPPILCYNLEKRMIPRCLVIKVLLLKGLLNKQLSAATFLPFCEEQFLEKFVTNYLEEIPQLLSVYNGEMNISELGFSTEEIRGLKP